MEDFKKKFVVEALDHINDLEESLLVLENAPTDKDEIETTFRAMHSLKGGGAMFGFDEISQITHDLETIYDKIREGTLTVSSQLISLTFKVIDVIKDLLQEEDFDKKEFDALLKELKQFSAEDLQTFKAESAADVSKDLYNTYFIRFEPDAQIMENGTNPLFLIDELTSLGKCYVRPDYSKQPAWEDQDFSNCYFSWSIVLSGIITENELKDVFIFVEDDCSLEIERIYDGDIFAIPDMRQMIASFAGADYRMPLKLAEFRHFLALHTQNTSAMQDRLTEGAVEAGENRKTKQNAIIASIRVASEKVDMLMNLVSELVTTQARLSLFADNFDNPELTAIAENIQKLSRELRDNAFSIVLIPIESIMTRFQRMVRDLSAELHKETIFETVGGETELDKTIIENLTDPLMHILRNSLDHGLECPVERIAAGKPRAGKISFKAFHSGPNVFIQVSDDGRGLDVEKIRAKAIAKKMISHEQNLSDRDIFELIFLPGFSTAESVSDISGRGVGMDVVRKKISAIRGEIEVDSTFGKGTCITIKLPLTLSIIDGLLVKVSDIFFIFPLSAISKIFSMDSCQTNYGNLVVVDGEQIPFFDLKKEFALSHSSSGSGRELVVVRSEDKVIGMVVDSVLGEYQAVLKPLGKHYKDQEVVSGATILGDGTIALVIDTGKAIKKFASSLNTVEA
jgi:two-component system, chemotaxis family, sensor kinase CheA